MSWKTLLQKIIKKENICVAAAHSRLNHLPIELIIKWLDLAIAWIREEGFEPSSFSTYGVSGYHDAKTYPFSDSLRVRLEKLDSGSIKHIGIYGGKAEDVSVSLTNAHVQHAITRIVWSWLSVDNISYDKIMNALSIANDLKLLEYGFSYYSNDRDYYTTPANLSPFDREIDRNNVWVGGEQALRAFKEGRHPIFYLRDVYPLQVLSAEHLSLAVGSYSLKDWINEDQVHGYLKSLKDDKFIWVIEGDQVDAVKAELASHNLLTAYIPKQGSILEMYGK